MSEVVERKGSSLLVIGQDPAARERVAETLEALRPGLHRIARLEPADVEDPTDWVDALAAFVVASGPNAGDGLSPIARLRETGCGGRVALLIDRDLDPLEAEAFAALLTPRVVLDHPASRLAIASALDRIAPPDEIHSARAQYRSAPGLLGVSRAIRDVAETVRRIATSRISVLILGETGTGKEVVARAIHRESDRRDAAFVAINCGALPEALLESELFGSERGAFTGASRDRPGVFEQAHGGTLFLDEIGEMPPAMQVKLLRVLEEGEVRRLGGNRSIAVDVRVVSATHRDLEAATGSGAFRQDLLFRLNTTAIRLPPLRRRAVDIPFLAQHFAEEFGAEQARHITLSEEFIEALCNHDFPGNVRELRNAVERAIAMAAPSEFVAREHLPPTIEGAKPWQQPVGSLKDRVAQLEAHVIRETLALEDGNRTRTAKALGLSRAGLRQKIERLGLE